MRHIVKRLFFIILFGTVSSILFGMIGPRVGGTKPSSGLELRAVCQPGQAEVDQSINNVRARLSTGGDVWWDRQRGLYIVPKPAEGQQPVSAIFAGGVWVGGKTRAGTIKLAGVTYRTLTDNFDWYPGPLDEFGATESEICKNWDKIFKVLGRDVLDANIKFLSSPETLCDSMPDELLYYPGKGNIHWDDKYDFPLPEQSMGAFWDENGDGIYDPCDGDFPTVEIRGCAPFDRKAALELVPDEMFFWVYNDNGGPPRLTKGDAIQMEVQVQAFAYATNDEVNDMTFQRYKLINKANEDLIDCYFAMWVDPDLGCYSDDYIGCDMTVVSGKPRSLAYTYNEDASDGNNGCNCSGGSNTYCENIPIVGTDYFRGPRGPKVFKRNNGEIVYLDGKPILLDPTPGTGEVDTLVELGMTSFTYMNNSQVGNPEPQTVDPTGVDEQYYNCITGLWASGDPVTFGGSGFNPGKMDTVKYVFTDAPNKPGWSMCTAQLPQGDRRTLQATGPLLLQPGATNELIIGVVFVPDFDYPCPDITRFLSADDIAQSLFDNCFDITDGPDAPDVCGIELDKEIILALSNDRFSSNNYNLSYSETDLRAPNDTVKYRFEGYKIFQLADAGVSSQELGDITKARLVFQTDINNGVSEIFNWTSEINPFNGSQKVWSFTRKVQGEDKGISNTFRVLEDQFATGDRALVNQKQYHFLAISYAYNNYEPFNVETGLGQRTAYLEGRRNIKTYSFTPRPIVYQNINANYNDGVIITRLSGIGTGQNFLDITDETREAILNAGTSFDGKIVYKEGYGPLSVKIFDPIEVQNGEYRLEINGDFSNSSSTCTFKPGARWVLTNTATSEVIASDFTIDKLNEQLIAKKGFSISIAQAGKPGTENNGSRNGAIGQTITYKDPNGPDWFKFLGDNGGSLATNLSFVLQDFIDPILPSKRNPGDPNGVFNNFGSGHFFPFASARWDSIVTNFFISPAFLEQNAQSIITGGSGNLKVKDLNNVDIVMTSNKELWSRCVVVETANPNYYQGAGLPTLDNIKMLDLRETPSIDKDGKPDGTGTKGMSWFPGYAIDVETGKRLNIFFGENTTFNNPNTINYVNLLDSMPNYGRNWTTDMIFNPSSQIISNSSQLPLGVVMGGQQFIYVTRQEYDGCAQFAEKLNKANLVSKKYDPMSAITWTCVPLVSADTPLKSIADGIIPNDVTIKLRVQNLYGPERIINNLDRMRRCDSKDESPVYLFQIKDKEALDLTQDEYEGALANVNVVPNPYYAYSAYETSQFVNTVKITNLPDEATVTIYTLDGKFIRQYKRDERPAVKSGKDAAINASQTKPSLEWDMKNFGGIPVSSGVYLIHVSSPGLGERTLKWFGINRKFDPTGL